jgi:23S rRNA (pseudouridine1915-N3)-methyltransferase
MKITIAAVGKLKAGAEAELVRRYIERASDQGRALGVAIVEREIGEGKETRAADRAAREAGQLIAAVPDTAAVVVLDERGKSLTSPQFANWLKGQREDGTADLVFMIGGPDGLDESVRKRAGLVLSFGAMTMPHQLVRALLAEQIYRALTIIAGHPYHRV